MSGVHASQQDVDIDLGGLFGAIWRNRMRVLMATVASAGLAFAGASLITPTYKSETRLLIETREPAFTTGADRAQGREQPPVLDELGIVSQVQLLKSADLIKQVARDMKLYELEEFDPTAKPSALSDLFVLVGLKKNPLELAPEERVLKEFNEKLAVYQVEKSRVIGIEFTSKDPRLAAEIPNEMAKVYMSLQSGAKLDTNSEATRWLEPEIANLREKVREAEQKVAEYRAQSDLLPTGENATFAVKQLNDISSELARVRGERANAEARAEGVRAVLQAGGAPDTLSDVVGSQMIQRLKESESQIQGQISDLSTSLLDGHPRLKGLRSQLEGIRGQIKAETRKILSSLENEAKTARFRETQLVQQLNTVKADTARAGEDEVGLKALEREATAQRQLLETYLARYREATSRTGSNSTPADARVISAAVEPTEVAFPKVLPITLVGGLAGFALSAVAILLAELFSGRALKPVGAVVAPPVARRRRRARAPQGRAAASRCRRAARPACARPLAALRHRRGGGGSRGGHLRRDGRRRGGGGRLLRSRRGAPHRREQHFRGDLRLALRRPRLDGGRDAGAAHRRRAPQDDPDRPHRLGLPDAADGREPACAGHHRSPRRRRRLRRHHPWRPAVQRACHPARQCQHQAGDARHRPAVDGDRRAVGRL